MPAILREFHPALDQEELDAIGDRYTVEDFTDITRRERRRDKGKEKQVLFRDDKEMADCRLADVTFHSEVFESNADIRPSTPSTLQLRQKPFDEMDHLERIVYIRPHLLTVIQETYPPAQARIDAFYRKQILGLPTGGVDDEIISQWYIPELERWALRAERGLQGSETECPRPSGSQRYEKLSAGRRRQVRLVSPCRLC